MLNKKAYFIREHVGFLKLVNTYDIIDPDTREQLGIAIERPGNLIQVLRLLLGRQILPTKVFVYEGDNPQSESKLLFSIHKGLTLFRAKVTVMDRDGKIIGSFLRILFSIGAAFTVFDADGKEIALLKGDWKGWNFRFLDTSKSEIGKITKKWAGVGKELFTTADDYIITLNQDYPPATNLLLLAAGLAIDTVHKERK